METAQIPSPMNLLRGLFGTSTLWRVLTLVCILTGSSKAQQDADSALANSNDQKAPVAANRTEATWIVHSVAEEITRLAEYAAKVDSELLRLDPVTVTTLPSDDRGYHYKVAVHLPKQEEFQEPIDIPGAIWNPSAYGSLTEKVLAKLQLTPQSPQNPIGGNPLALLATPRVEVIQAENRRISQWLTEHPLDAAAHEQAALVLGSLGMRENAGSFWDTRGFCNHATAHLALARALNPSHAQSDCGAVAELLIGLLIDTKSDCQKRIEELVNHIGNTPELEPWVIAAKLRNTRDYRVARTLEKSTLLEKI